MVTVCIQSSIASVRIEPETFRLTSKCSGSELPRIWIPDVNHAREYPLLCLPLSQSPKARDVDFWMNSASVDFPFYIISRFLCHLKTVEDQYSHLRHQLIDLPNPKSRSSSELTCHGFCLLEEIFIFWHAWEGYAPWMLGRITPEEGRRTGKHDLDNWNGVEAHKVQ